MNRSPKTELGAFLWARRAKVEPDMVGLARQEGRRVPGLRREEVARLAGVSVDYYTKLEQGRHRTASPSVLKGLARALRLTTDEHEHLRVLAGVSSPASLGDPLTRIVHPRTLRVMDLLGDTPAIVFGPFLEIIASNRAAAFLFADFSSLPRRQRNGLHWILTSTVARERYAEGWTQAVSEMVGMLRLDGGRYPDHPRLRELVAELSACSPLFRKLWQEITVSRWWRDEKVLYHETFGRLRFYNEFISLHSAPEQRLVAVIPADAPSFLRALVQERTHDVRP
ncbi:helix-turn-helix domain-containing protein [Streptomyces sp. 049-1]|uniref:helix-turn-helix domain-containing protein n=1 Tax=Streptomyces sp. 049-1 TaxID=2789264 RepID=UPI00397FFC80